MPAAVAVSGTGLLHARREITLKRHGMLRGIILQPPWVVHFNSFNPLGRNKAVLRLKMM